MASDRKKRAKKRAAASKARRARLVIRGPHPGEIPGDDWRWAPPAPGLSDDDVKVDSAEEDWARGDRMDAMARAGDSAATIAKAEGVPLADARSFVTAEKRRLRLIERRAPFPLRKAAVEAFKAILAYERVPVQRAEMTEETSSFWVDIAESDLTPDKLDNLDAMVDEAAKESGLMDYYEVGGGGSGFGVRDISYIARSKPRKRGAKGWSENPPPSRRQASKKKPPKKDRRKLLSRLLRGT